MDRIVRKKIVDAFVERCSRIYDLLYLYGERLGTKAMVDDILESYRMRHPEANILRTDAERFRAETIGKVMAGEHYDIAVCDLFVLEDVDGIPGLETNEQRLYGMLDWLLENHRQIIVSGTMPTAGITNLAHRIRAQIDGGIAFAIAECDATLPK